MGNLTQAASEIMRTSMAAQQESGASLLRQGAMKAQSARAVPQALLGMYDAFNSVADSRFKRQEMDFKGSEMLAKQSLRGQMDTTALTPETLSGITAGLDPGTQQFIRAVNPRTLSQLSSLLDGTAGTLQKLYQDRDNVEDHNTAARSRALREGMPVPQRSDVPVPGLATATPPPTPGVPPGKTPTEAAATIQQPITKKPTQQSSVPATDWHDFGAAPM